MKMKSGKMKMYQVGGGATQHWCVVQGAVAQEFHLLLN